MFGTGMCKNVLLSCRAAALHAMIRRLSSKFPYMVAKSKFFNGGLGCLAVAGFPIAKSYLKCCRALEANTLRRKVGVHYIWSAVRHSAESLLVLRTRLQGVFVLHRRLL